jgi:membrane fusion protein
MDAASRTSLFRKELLRKLAHRLHGDISIALPVSWQLLGYFLFAVLVVSLIFVNTASYARVEIVTGAVALDKGVIAIMPSRPGIVTELPVREGMKVEAGEQLLRIRSEEDLVRGDTAPERILTALGQQDQSFEAQAEHMKRAALAEQARLQGQAVSLGREIESLDVQISLQRRLAELAQNLFEHAEKVAAQGYISRVDLDASEVDLLSKRQQLTQLEQARAARVAELTGVHASMSQASSTAQAQVENLTSNRAQIAQQIAQAQSAQGYSLTSPVGGTVTAVTARVGQPASAAAAAMLLVPADARLLAELHVPSSAVGFLEIGQEVNLDVDAFPYQRFGVVKGRITDIASAALIMNMPDGKPAPIYLVSVSLPQPWVEAFGRRQPLLAGMTVSGRIVTRRQTLVEWLFEPLYSVTKR